MDQCGQHVVERNAEEIIPQHADVQGTQKKGGREFDETRHRWGQVALQVAYVGWAYQGLAYQPNLPPEATVEGCLFAALRRTRLVRELGASAGGFPARYSRCGRTDRGVSAFGQVVALEARLTPAGLDYAHVLNRALPEDIRVVAHALVPRHFNARHDCLYRRYRYFFVRDGLDLHAMNEAAAHFVGEHDFAQFCKADLAAQSTRRRILWCRVEVLPEQEANVAAAAQADEGRRVLPGLGFIEVAGTAFLWHQVRCMAAVLLLIGRGLERPELVCELLRRGAEGPRVQYAMASEVPLVLVECGFEDVLWVRSPTALAHLEAQMRARLHDQALRLAVAACFARQLDLLPVPQPDGAPPLPWGQLSPRFAWPPRRHTPLLAAGQSKQSLQPTVKKPREKESQTKPP